MKGAWIYFNQMRGKWQVKHRAADNEVVVLAEYETRGEAYRAAAWGIWK